MTEDMQAGVTVTGGSTEGCGCGCQPAPIGARLLAALFDLVLVPIILGIVFGLLFFAADPTFRNLVLVFVNIAWTCLRDIKGGAGPGKRMSKIKVIDVKTGEAPTIGQLIVRNLLLWVPFVLMIGFIVESIIVFVMKQDRLGDRWAKCKVVTTA